MHSDIPLALTYSDVLIVPKRSSISSRSLINTRTRLTRELFINIPIITANMDSVTESEMAIAIARLGGIGIIHRFLTIEENVEEVARVKRAESFIIEEPYTLGPLHSVRAARALMAERGISGILIVDTDKQLLGIVSRRDILFEGNDDRPLAEVMSGKDKLIVGSPKTSFEEARQILHKYRIEKLPLVDQDYHVVGLVTAEDVQNQSLYPLASKDKKGRLLVGASVGVKDDFVERSQALKAAGADLIVIDIAHGHSELMLKAIVGVREAVGTTPIIAGNIATADAVRDLCNAGVDAVKVGVGPGTTCTTRLVTGAGVPQLSAVLECASAAEEYNIPIIADGGIQRSGDIVKAIGAGASSVMCGGIFAGTKESPGVVMISDDKKYKVCRGSSSFAIAQRRKKLLQERKRLDDVVPEGVESVTPYKGEVEELVRQLVGGLKSGMSYCNAVNIEELRGKVQFVRITSAGLRESGAHDVENAKGSYV